MESSRMGFDEQSGMVKAGAGKKADGTRKMPNDERGKTPFAVCYALLCFALFCFTLFFFALLFSDSVFASCARVCDQLLTPRGHWVCVRVCCFFVRAPVCFCPRADFACVLF
jgi:hypothetical protein